MFPNRITAPDRVVTLGLPPQLAQPGADLLDGVGGVGAGTAPPGKTGQSASVSTLCKNPCSANASTCSSVTCTDTGGGMFAGAEGEGEGTGSAGACPGESVTIPRLRSSPARRWRLTSFHSILWRWAPTSPDWTTALRRISASAVLRCSSRIAWRATSLRTAGPCMRSSSQASYRRRISPHTPWRRAASISSSRRAVRASISRRGSVSMRGSAGRSAART